MSFDRRATGFTLIELMIAIAVVGLVSLVVYRLFDVTHSNFREVDELADVNERLRFATERVRYYLQAAGSQGTPDSAMDDWVAPPMTTGRVAGLLPYANWQGTTANSPLPPLLLAANAHVSFDGIIVMGAFDYPMSFELAGMETGFSPRVARLYNHYRGVLKLQRQDPFLFGNETIQPISAGGATGLRRGDTALASPWRSRLLRVADRQGFQQFLQPMDIQATGPGMNPPQAMRQWYSIPLQMDGHPFGPKFKLSAAGFVGLDDLNESDVAYDAALIDAFWIHVVPDSSNPNVMALVRDRLCAADVAARAGDLSYNPATSLPAAVGGCGENERVVIASQIADFQVWFDCTDPTSDGRIANQPWAHTWRMPLGGGCMMTAPIAPGLARVGHVRIAMHTKTERKDQAHTQFEDAIGAICTPACDTVRLDAATLRTYDIEPQGAGAAPVVVMQTDFELVNFVNRNPLP